MSAALCKRLFPWATQPMDLKVLRASAAGRGAMRTGLGVAEASITITSQLGFSLHPLPPSLRPWRCIFWKHAPVTFCICNALSQSLSAGISAEALVLEAVLGSRLYKIGVERQTTCRRAGRGDSFTGGGWSTDSARHAEEMQL